MNSLNWLPSVQVQLTVKTCETIIGFQRLVVDLTRQSVLLLVRL